MIRISHKNADIRDYLETIFDQTAASSSFPSIPSQSRAGPGGRLLFIESLESTPLIYFFTLVGPRPNENKPVAVQ